MMSRCITPHAWQCSSALNSCAASRFACPKRSECFSAMDSSPARSCSTYSNTRYIEDLSLPHATSSRLTMLGCSPSRANTSTSLAMNSSDVSSMFARRMCFSATTPPVTRSFPRYTVEYVPCPTLSMRRYVRMSRGRVHPRRRMASPACRSIHAGHPDGSCRSDSGTRSASESESCESWD